MTAVLPLAATSQGMPLLAVLIAVAVGVLLIGALVWGARRIDRRKPPVPPPGAEGARAGSWRTRPDEPGGSQPSGRGTGAEEPDPVGPRRMPASGDRAGPGSASRGTKTARPPAGAPCGRTGVCRRGVGPGGTAAAWGCPRPFLDSGAHRCSLPSSGPVPAPSTSPRTRRGREETPGLTGTPAHRAP
ncbi:DUF6479 family protein [Kitasatospora sp. NPDC085464]|uniref:DUF6479 family protein n=1 Tax=Kitasatospora sp. NPDC085464 TaxID=3364063 RepID=UPI0037C92BD0